MITTTGHSLGGWLAQVTALEGKSKYKDSLHIHCVTFDTPGAKAMLEKLDHRFYYKKNLHKASKNQMVSKFDFNQFLFQSSSLKEKSINIAVQNEVLYTTNKKDINSKIYQHDPFVNKNYDVVDWNACKNLSSGFRKNLIKNSKILAGYYFLVICYKASLK